MYCMYVKVDNSWLTAKELENGLNVINNDVRTRVKFCPLMHRVQILTSDVRSTWAVNREKLINGKW